MVYPADTRHPLRRARPLEEGDHRAGAADRVAEVEVVAAGVVEVNRLLDEAQPEHAGIEVDRPLRVAADDRDVMDALNARAGRAHHAVVPLAMPDRLLPRIGAPPLLEHEGEEGDEQEEGEQREDRECPGWQEGAESFAGLDHHPLIRVVLVPDGQRHRGDAAGAGVDGNVPELLHCATPGVYEPAIRYDAITIP